MVDKTQIKQWWLLIDITTLYRKYEIGDLHKFQSEIQKIRKVHDSHLEDAWQKGAGKIKHDDIVKDAKSLSESEEVFCKKKAEEILNGKGDIKHFLLAEFDPKKYKLDDENRIRRVRNILAEKYIVQLTERYKLAVAEEKSRFASKLKNYVIAANIVFVGISGASLTPLYQEYYKYKREVKEWRENGIANSPTVCLTRTGQRYHDCYHYSKRNYEISLFEAVIDKHKTPCGTCDPPTMDFGDKPKSIYPNPFLISLLPIGIGIWGNGYAQRKKEEIIKQTF